MAIREWLQGLGLERYASSFEYHAVEEASLRSLTSDDLKELGVELVGHRRRLLEAIGAERSKPHSFAPEESTAAPSDEAERRSITILFCDLVGSTEMATREDPEDLRDLMSGYQRTCAETIAAFGGHVARYMGDGLLAYFGYPKTRENEAENALRAALALVQAVNGLAGNRGERLAVRIGIATGLVVVGDLIGKGDAAERSVIGETPNLAARFQVLANPGEIVCASRTRRLAGGLFIYEDMGEQVLKGFSKQVRAWRVVGERIAESRFHAIHEHPISDIVGRTHERMLMIDRWNTAKEGEGQVVLITGEPGIGKSRLIQHFIAQMAGECRYRFSYQCSPHYRDTPFSAVIRQIEITAGLGGSDDVSIRREKLRKLLREAPDASSDETEFLELMGLSMNDGTSENAGESVRKHILTALVRRIERVTELGAVLCVLEDAHWIDPSTQEFLTLLAERIENLPVMLIVSYRIDFACPWIQFPHATQVKLNRLTRAQSAAMVTLVAGERPLPESVLREIVRKTDGIPLFLEEVTRALVESGKVPVPSPEGILAESQMPITVPETLHDTLLSRLDRDETAKQVAQVASTIGREFAASLLAQVADLPGERIEAGLEVLVQSGLIVRSTIGSEINYTFRHGLLQEVTYGTLLMRKRRELHRRIAQAMVGAAFDFAKRHPELVARHYDSAEDFETAAKWWLEAGRNALRSGSYGEALGHLEAGLRVVERMPATRVRSERELPLRVAVAETCRSARFSCENQALEACRRARELSEELSNSSVLIQTLRLEFGIIFNRPDLPGMERIGREFERLSVERGDEVAAVLARQSLGCVAFFTGQIDRAREQFHAALSAAKDVKEPARLVDMQFPITALCYLSWSELLSGRVNDARATARDVLRRSEGMSRFAESLALANTLLFDRLLGDEDLIRTHLDRLKAISEARGIAYWIDLVRMHEGLEKLGDGRVEEGLDDVRRALATFKSHAVEIEVPFFLGQIAESLSRAAWYDEALATLEDAFQRIERSGERWFLPELHRIRAETMMAGDPAAAEVDLRHAMTLARSQGSLLLELRAATSLLRVVSSRSARRTGFETLANLVNRFEPSLQTRDLLGARTILGESRESAT